jgi:hypothetical protein
MLALSPLRLTGAYGDAGADADDAALDDLLTDDLLSALAPEDGWASDAPWAAAVPALLPRARCLDGTHRVGGAGACGVCVPPPAAGEEHLYELRGQGASKNGEKRLRSQVSRTAEWACVEAREAAAAAAAGACGGAQGARLGAALRERRSSSLRKDDLLWLCRAWGYASDIWARRKSRLCTRRVRGAALAAPPAQRMSAAALLPLPPPFTLPDAPPPAQLAVAHAALEGPLRELAARSARAFGDTRVAARLLSRLAAGAPPLALPRRLRAALDAALRASARDLATARGAIATLAAQAAAATHAAHAARAALVADAADAGAPAWRAMRGREHAWEPLARAMGQLVEFGLASGEELRRSLHADVVALHGGPSASFDEDEAACDVQDVALARETCDKDAQVVEDGMLVLELVRPLLARALTCARRAAERWTRKRSQRPTAHVDSRVAHSHHERSALRVVPCAFLSRTPLLCRAPFSHARSFCGAQLSRAGSLMAHLKASSSYETLTCAGAALLALLASFLSSVVDGLGGRLEALHAAQRALAAA